MSTASNAKIQYESGQDFVAYVALTDQGDHTDFRSADNFWSNRAGYVPSVRPNGLVTGGAIIPAASGLNEGVDVAALTCYVSGVLVTVGADTDVVVVRPAVVSPVKPYKKDSIVVTSGAIAVVEGTAGAAFSTTRAAEGGPPLIPVDSIEIGQVWMSASATADISATEIKQVIGTNCERYDYPTWEESRFNVSSGVLGYAGVTFASALPLIHTGAIPKKVYAQYYEPSFTDVSKTTDFRAPETTYSTSSQQIYGQTIGSSTESLGGGSFTVYLGDGISDGILALKGCDLFFRFYQNRLNSTPYILTQGILGISRTFPAGGQITAACTISAESEAVEVVG